MEKTIICPVCGEYHFCAVDSQEKCPVCGWVNDKFQTEHPFVGRGANPFSLAQQKKAWKILKGEYEVGYGADNLHWGVSCCDLCKERIGVDECYCKVKQLMAGNLPVGVADLNTGRDICAKCLFQKNAELEDMKKSSSMVSKNSGWDTYGNGSWYAGSDEYDVAYYQKMLKSLIEYCHGEENAVGAGYNSEPNATYAEVKDRLLALMAADEQGRRNYESYFSRPLLSILDFIHYATDAQGNLDHRFDLWAFGGGEYDKYEFTPEEKRNAEQVLHITLSFINYKCDTYYAQGLYYLDNCYEHWDIDEFKDTIAAWFVDIGEDLDKQFIKDFIQETLKESFAVSHVKLALYLMANLDFAKADPELQRLAGIYCRVPELRELAKECLYELS